MAVPYYIGEHAIAQRLGLRSPRVITKLAISDGLPIYPRRIRNKSGKGYHRAYAISESAITAWELTQGMRFTAQLRARRALKLEQKQGALVA